ncbi:MAG: TonB-dependent receptor [Lysobacterales bacterium]
MSSQRGIAELWGALLIGATLPCCAVAQSATQQLPAVNSRDDRPLTQSLSATEVDTRRPVDMAVDPLRALSLVPGLLGSDRRNEAQDVRLSVRGFGARSAFGVRGLQIVVDGIPASLPDGQAQLSHIPWQADAAIRVERGPLAALAGNGGALIEVQTLGELTPGGQAELVLAGGGRRRLGAGYHWPSNAASSCAGCGLGLDVLLHENAGFRPHSAAERQQLAGRLSWADGGGGRWDARWHALNSLADDPLGLDRQQLAQAPDSTTSAALLFDTRKRLQHAEIGLGRTAASERWQWSVHVGNRQLRQFLAVPVAVQNSPTHPGGVIDLSRQAAGLQLSGGNQIELNDRGWRWRLRHDRQDEQRRGYENFVGQNLGLRGALRRDERNRASVSDGMVEGWWRRGDWLWRAGVRATELRARSRDRYINGSNSDDSGRSDEPAVLPVLAVAWQSTTHSQWQLSAGSGLDSPTLAERAYSPSGGGFNPDLRSTRHQQVELAWRWQASASLQLEAAAFALRSSDELAVVESSGGRTVFDNLGDGHRRGLELAASGEVGVAQWRLAATWLDARLRDGGLDQRLPGVATRWFGMQWQRPVGHDSTVGMDYFASAAVPVDLGSNERASGFGRLDLWWLRRAIFDSPIELGLRVDNVFDRRHAASVIVAERNGRYYEPAAGREWALSLGWRW